jgi:hypothetical protein
VELAIATSIPPAAWAGEDDATLATALVVLAEQVEAVRRGR